MPICPHCATDYTEGTEHNCPEKPSAAIHSDQSELKNLVEDMPKVVPDAVEASQKKEDEAKKAQGEAVDNKGRKFDPKLHKFDKDGNPIFTKTGRFTKKLNIPEGSTAPAAPAVDLIAQEAKEWAVLVVTLTAAFVAEEAQPTPAEFERMQIGFEGVFRKYGVLNMGCELVLATSMSAYMFPRLLNPKKPTPLYTGVKTWIMGFFPKKKEDKKDEVKK
jgi:hypothetical protein